MSNSKKLTYTMEEPAFLARLRSAAAGAGRQERHIAPRNRKSIRAEDDDDDAPAYVLEETGEALSREEFILLGGRGGEKEEKGNEGNGEEGEKMGEKVGEEGEKVAAQVVAEAGMRRKRKAAKIIGADEEEEKDKEDKKPPSPAKKKVKAKRKVKLSFGDDE